MKKMNATTGTRIKTEGAAVNIKLSPNKSWFKSISGCTLALVWGIQSPAGPMGAIASSTDFQSSSLGDLLLLGPVDQVQSQKSMVHVLGQWVVLPKNQVSQNIQDLMGQLVAVYGQVNTDGSSQVTRISTLSASNYVPGATQLYLKGQITSIDAANGTARVGQLVVNYSGALHKLVAADLSNGSVVSFGGVQFANVNTLYASDGYVQHLSAGSSALGQIGSGGTHIAGQIGSGGTQIAGQIGSGGTHIAGQIGSGGTQIAGQIGSGGTHTAGQIGSGGTHIAGQIGSGGTQIAGQIGSGGTHIAGQIGSGGTQIAGQIGDRKSVV